MTKVVITGADGFTGRYVATVLAREGYEVHAIGRNAAQQCIEGIARTHVCDLLDAQHLSDIVKKVKPVKVVHLAAISFVAHENVEAIYCVNIMGTRNLLAALDDHADDCDAILIASSANVYGNAKVDKVTEDTALAPVNDYAVSKVAMEYLAQTYADRLPLIITRPFNYTGRGQSDKFLVSKIVDHIRRKEDKIELGNLNIGRDFSDVRDVADAYCKLLEAPSAIGKTLNVCSEQVYTIADIIEITQRISGHNIDVVVNPAFIRSNELHVLRGSREKFESVVGEVSCYDLEDTISWMLQ